MSEVTEETVYLAPRRNRYHTNENCPGLNNAQVVSEESRSDIDADIPVCKYCSGDYSPSSTSNSLEMRQLLLELDPDDIG